MGDAPGTDRKAALCAPAERLTGVRVNEELLAQAACQRDGIPQEPAGARESVTIGVRDAHGERTHVQLRRDRP
ncbi:DUF6461 domain-containing protein [Streptomyces sp. NPDC007095]|uniref:DUF6461 domain-containing protein n=1 Tax=Streptomyces sp. NPDC007095 TaxID=3154482 RepID=UPI00340D2A5D